MIISIYIILLSGAGNGSYVFRLDKIYIIAHMDEVQTIDSAIRQIYHYPVDSRNQLLYPLDSDLSIV